MNSSKGRHRAPSRTAKMFVAGTPARRAAVVGTIPIALAVACAGVSVAAPVQPGTETPAPSQPGTNTPAPEQPGTTAPAAPPEAPPAPEPEPAPAPEVEDAPGLPYVPEPPSTLPSREEPTYYEEPAPAMSEEVLHAPEPVAPVAPIAPPPNKLRFGTYETERPDWVSPEAMNSANRWAAYGEAEIARGWNSVGLSPERSDRLAATSTAAGVAGGLIGATAAGVPAAAIGAVPGAVVGAAAGGAIGYVTSLPIGFNVVPGALIGAGVGAAAGAAALGVPAAIAGGTAGAVAGVAVGTAMGAGDANKDQTPPDLPDLGLPRVDARSVVHSGVDATHNAVNWTKAQPGGSEALAAAPGVAAQATQVAKRAEPVTGAVVNAAQQAGAQATSWVAAQPGGADLVAAVHEAGPQMPAEIANIGGAMNAAYYAK